jgi:hypothetical protein
VKKPSREVSNNMPLGNVMQGDCLILVQLYARLLVVRAHCFAAQQNFLLIGQFGGLVKGLPAAYARFHFIHVQPLTTRP